MSDCILWPGRFDKDGYGILWAGGQHRAHRFIYSLFFGPVPAGMHVLHTCDNPKCVNPSHLCAGTHRENMADRVAKKHYPIGVLTARAKLTADQVRAIRSGLTCREACARFDIRKSTYYNVRNGDCYPAETL